MAEESYYEKRKRIREEQKKRNEKLVAEKKRKELAKKQLEMAKSLSSKRPTKSKSSKLGSSSYSAGSKNPTSVFQDKKTTTKKKDTNKAVSVVKNMFKNKGKANAEESALPRNEKSKKKTTAASTVKVSSGNTLSGIARSKGITLKALLAANPNISDPNKIRVGQNIKIPESGKGSVYKGMTKEEMAKLAMNRGGTTAMMKKKTKYMAKGGMKKTKYMAKGGAAKKTKMYSRGGAAKRK